MGQTSTKNSETLASERPGREYEPLFDAGTGLLWPRLKACVSQKGRLRELGQDSSCVQCRCAVVKKVRLNANSSVLRPDTMPLDTVKGLGSYAWESECALTVGIQAAGIKMPLQWEGECCFMWCSLSQRLSSGVSFVTLPRHCCYPCEIMLSVHVSRWDVVTSPNLLNKLFCFVVICWNSICWAQFFTVILWKELKRLS